MRSLSLGLVLAAVFLAAVAVSLLLTGEREPDHGRVYSHYSGGTCRVVVPLRGGGSHWETSDPVAVDAPEMIDSWESVRSRGPYLVGGRRWENLSDQAKESLKMVHGYMPAAGEDLNLARPPVYVNGGGMRFRPLKNMPRAGE